jgi:hypothetical protein
MTDGEFLHPKCTAGACPQYPGYLFDVGVLMKD